MRKPVYFPVLNALRFYAAFSVLIDHVEGYAFGFEMQSRTGLRSLILTGHDAVTLFFVLSGFLITHILLTEKRDTGTISPRRFYWRRSVRIFPLYFLVLALTLVFFPQYAPETAALPAYLLLSACLVVPFLQTGLVWHFWSVSVEEWFYAVWSPLLRRFHVLKLAAAIIGLRLLIGWLCFPDHFSSFEGIFVYNSAPELVLFRFLRFECMAIGAVGAWLVLNRHWTLRLVYRLDKPVIALTLLIIVFFDELGGIFYDLTLSLVFITLILNACTNPRSWLRGLEHPLTRQLGDVTYGLYMLHPICIVVVAALLARLQLPPSAWSDSLLYVTASGMSIVVALASYRWFERPLLRLKTMRLDHLKILEGRYRIRA